MRRALPTLLLTTTVAAVALAGCSSDERIIGGANPPSPTASPSTSSTTTGSPSATATGSGPAVAAAAIDPCTLVTRKQIGRLVGAMVMAHGDDFSGLGNPTLSCRFDNDDPDVPSVSLQTTPATDSLQAVATLLGVGGDATEPIQVDGAEEALVSDDDDPDFPTSTVFAKVDGQIVSAVVLAGDLSTARRIAVEAATLLVAGVAASGN